jgi:hypothetical protein
MKTIIAGAAVLCLTGLLQGCVVAPAPYAYGPAYGPAPAYYAAPAVSVGIGVSDYGGHGGYRR